MTKWVIMDLSIPEIVVMHWKCPYYKSVKSNKTISFDMFIMSPSDINI